MKTKMFYGIRFNVYTNTKIDGDFIKPDEAVYFENDVEITGRLEVKYLKTNKSIVVNKSYVVSMWEEIGGYQEIGWYQKIGEYQKIGKYQEIGEYQEIGWYQKIGEYQKIGKSQKIGWSQKIGEYQEIGGNATINQGIVVGLSIKVKGTLKFSKRLFAGVCNWRDITEEEKTITCGKFDGGKVEYGILKEIGIPEVKKKKRGRPKLTKEERIKRIEVELKKLKELEEK